jgi:superfamily I DNA/RNA helicase
VSNLNAATGLEAAVVFLLGADSLLASEADPRLDADARAELVADHTRLLYMAATRAAQRLVIFSHTPAVTDWLLELGAIRADRQ